MSDILNAVHHTIRNLYELKAVDRKTLREFEAICLSDSYDVTSFEDRDTKAQTISSSTLPINRDKK